MNKEEKNQVISYLSFQIGSEIFAANVKNVINILEMTKITSVPKSPDYMKGVINLRGSVLPVLDTRLKFGLKEAEYTTNTCILVMEIISKNELLKLGAIVDNVQEVLEIDVSEIQSPPSLGASFKSDFLMGMTKRNDNFIMIIDVNKVFADNEIINLQDITADIGK